MKVCGEDIEIVLPKGAFGADLESDDLIDSILREIAVAVGSPGEGAEKYGTDFENEMFLMRRYCWCEQLDCLWCCVWLSNEGDYSEEQSKLHRERQKAQLKARFGAQMIYPDCAPNFWYKPLNFQLCWYKYIGRDMETNKELTREQIIEMFDCCINSVSGVR